MGSSQPKQQNNGTLTLAELCLAIADGDVPVEQRGSSYLIRQGALNRYMNTHKVQNHRDEVARPIYIPARSA